MFLSRRRALLATAALILPAAASAQTASQPQATPQTIPGLDQFSLPGTPTPAPTPVPAPTTVPVPVQTPTPVPSPRATVAPLPRAAPQPRAEATPGPAGTPVPTTGPTPVVTPAPAATATPLPQSAPIPAPAATATPAPIATPEPAGEGSGGLWWLGGALAAVLLGLLVWRSRRGRTGSAPEELEVPATSDAPAPVAPAQAAPPRDATERAEPAYFTPSAPSLPRAQLRLELRPRRAGINLLSATVESEVAVTNVGDAPAERVRVGVKLLSAHAGQDTELAELYAQPINRPTAPPFSLKPGETRALRAVAVLPHGEIRSMTAAGRPMFIPVVAVNAVYQAADSVEGQTAQSFAVGVERVDSPKLAPFWLDAPARTTDQVAARPHAAAITR